MNEKKYLGEEELVRFLEKMGKQWRIENFGHDELTGDEQQIAIMMISEEEFLPMTSDEKKRALDVLEKTFKKIEEEKKRKNKK